MKFEFDGDADRGECVAYIDDDGDLCIRVGDGFVYFIKDDKSFLSDGGSFYGHMFDNGATRKFYKGDKITITF